MIGTRCCGRGVVGVCVVVVETVGWVVVFSFVLDVVSFEAGGGRELISCEDIATYVCRVDVMGKLIEA